MTRFIVGILLGVIRAFTETFEWATHSLSRKLDDDAERPVRRVWWKTILWLPLLLPYWVFQLVVAILVFPIAALGFEGPRRNRFLKGLPALMGCISISAVIMDRAANPDRINQRYARWMNAAIENNEYTYASLLGARLMLESQGRNPDVAFQVAMVLSKAGQDLKAAAMIRQLAPDEQVGYPPAHELRALHFAKVLNADSRDENLERLRWHLSNTGNSDKEQILLLWTEYYQRVGQIGEAIRKLERVAKRNPKYYPPLAELFLKSGNVSDAIRCMGLARNSLEKELAQRPDDKWTRIQLARTYTKLNQLAEAEKVLQEGLSHSTDADLLRANTDFYLFKYDLEMSRKGSAATSLEFLEKAIRLDPSYVAIFDKLVQFYRLNQTSAEGQRIEYLLEEMIDSQVNEAAAHFALSSILLLKGEKENSQSHLEKAFEMSPDMPVICNNLAWMMANSDPPKLDEALELSRQAVAKMPSVATFHDTLGTILLLQNKHLEAIKEFEIALIDNSNDRSLHSKLAQAYEALGNMEIAKMHLERSKK